MSIVENMCLTPVNVYATVYDMPTEDIADEFVDALDRYLDARVLSDAQKGAAGTGRVRLEAREGLVDLLRHYLLSEAR